MFIKFQHCDDNILPCEIVVNGPGKKGGSFSSDSSGSSTTETEVNEGWSGQRAIGFGKFFAHSV